MTNATAEPAKRDGDMLSNERHPAPRSGRGQVSRLRAAALVVALLIGLLGGAGSNAVDPSPAAAYPLGDGYWMVATDGGIFAFGDAQFFGSTGNIELNQPIVGMAAHPFLEGYWFVATDGGIFSFGSSGFYGSTGGITLHSPVTGMAAHPSGKGYWLVATDGGVFSFGASRFQGSMGGQPLNSPIVGMTATPSGNGYWLVAADGGIFSFGDAVFHGSTGDIKLNRPIVGMTTTPSGNGYWLVASDGGIFAFGDALFQGSTGGIVLNRPVVGMASTPSGQGYHLVATDGGIFSFGNAVFRGSTGNIDLNKPVIGMAQRPRLAVTADPFVPDDNSSSTWQQVGSDWQLALSNSAADTVPAGARILGVEGLNLDQLQTVKIALDAGSCANGPSMALYLDTNGDRVSDTTSSLSCSQLVAGVNAVTATGHDANTWVAGADLLFGTVGAVSVDDITVAGLTITDFRPVRAA